MLSHTSGAGPIPIWHTGLPAAQIVLPSVQMPQQLPAQVDNAKAQELFCVQAASGGQKSSHGLPTSVTLSSIKPLQSSSMPLQISTLGGNCGHMYSQPLPGFISRSLNPILHVPRTHLE